MSTAWGPRITAANFQVTDVTDAEETLVASITGLSTTEMNEQLWLHAQVGVQPGPDATAVVISAYLGPFALANQLVQRVFESSDLDGIHTYFELDALTDLGPNVEGQQIDITVSYTGATDAGGAGPGTVVATVF